MLSVGCSHIQFYAHGRIETATTLTYTNETHIMININAILTSYDQVHIMYFNFIYKKKKYLTLLVICRLTQTRLQLVTPLDVTLAKPIIKTLSYTT